MSPKHFTHGFKEQAVQKALTRGSKTMKTIAQELNVGYSTLERWIRDYKEMNPDKDKSQRPQDWTKEEQFQALMDTSAMDSEQRSRYCRGKGIFPHQLDAWRLKFTQPENIADATTNKAEIKTLKADNAALHKELRRKDKALAETAALLVLQKKFQALLEGEEK